MNRIKFYKDDTGWYADIPTYPGPKQDLAMVLGADEILDKLAGFRKAITIDILTDPIDAIYCLTALRVPKDVELGGGKWYTITLSGDIYALWLCDVVLFVLGEYPKEIPFNVVKEG